MRELGERLRVLRLDAGFTVEGAAEQLLVSASKISRLETAARKPSPRDVRDLCRVYGVSDAERDQLMELAAQAQETSWYQEADYIPGFRTFIGLEQAATDIAEWQPSVVPGLLQTEEYAKHLLRLLRPEGEWSADQVADVVASRIRRQEVLDSPTPPRLHIVLEELVLRRSIGSPDVMQRQIERLLLMAARPNVKIQVIPASVGAHPCLDQAFIVLGFADHSQRDVVYMENATGALFLDKENVVRQHRDLFDYLATRVALGETASLDLLRHF
jgi:transcriptional regulator with XRE-family HTH domain